MSPLVTLLITLLLATFITNGRCDGDDGITEATLLALETSCLLLAPPHLVRRFAKQLKTIRTACPAVENVRHSPRWAVGVLIAKVSDDQLEQIRTQYGEVTSRPLFADYKVLTFAKPYNPEVLAKELIALELVDSAEPDNIMGGGNSIQYNPATHVYTFTQGWGDCFAGCINKHYWEFHVFYSEAFLVREYGTPLGGGADVALA